MGKTVRTFDKDDEYHDTRYVKQQRRNKNILLENKQGIIADTRIAPNDFSYIDAKL